MRNNPHTIGAHRRAVLGGGVAGVITLTLSGCGKKTDDQAVRVGFLYPNLVTVILGVAKETGAYQRHDIVIQEERFASGHSVDGVQALWSGGLDIYVGGGPEVVFLNSRAIEQGAEVKLAVLSGANAGHTNFVLGNKTQAKTFDDLVGRNLRIAVSSPSSDHLALFKGWLRIDKRLAFEKLGWQFLTVNGADMPTALLTDQIDGFLHSEPTATLAQTAKAGRLFMSAHNGDFGANPPPMTFLVGRRAFLQEKPDMARQFLAALFDANARYAAASREENIKLISSWSGATPDVLGPAYERINPIMSMTKAQAQTWWEYVGEAMVTRGEISPKIQPFRDIFALEYQPLPASDL